MASAGPTTGLARRSGALALFVICVAQLMVVLDATIVNIALPSIQKDLHFSSAGLEWVVNAYALTFGGFLLLGGRTGDLYGRRRMFMIGVAVFTVSSLVGGFATGAPWLITARAVQGIGGAIAAPTALALLADNFAEGRSRNRAMGAYAGMSGAGGGVGLVLGGVLVEIASWRWVFFVNVPIGLLVLVLAPRALGRSTTRPGQLDLPGALTATGGMALLVYGLSHAATTSWSDPVTYLSLAVAGLLLISFVVIESRSPHALMPLRIFADRNRSGANGIMLCLGAAVFAMFFFITQYLQNVLGYSPLKAGLAFLPTAVGITVVAGVTSLVIGKVGPRIPATLGPLIVTVGLYWVSRISVHSTYPEVLGPMFCIATGMGMSFVPLTLAAVSKVATKETGLASAILNTGQQIGGSLGLAVLVTVAATTSRNLAHHLAVAFGSHPSHVPSARVIHQLANQVVTAGYRQAFLVAAWIAFGGFVIALATIRVTKPDAQSMNALAL
jgi:EmrB/QacA subfamily drug resistance transporter